MADKKLPQKLCILNDKKKGEQEDRVGLDVEITFPELNTREVNLFSPVENSRRLLNSFNFYLSGKQTQFKYKFCFVWNLQCR